MKKSSEKGGFTLVEVMVVIVIIGLIAMFGAAGLARAMRYRENAEVAQKMGVVTLAFESYRAETGGWPKESGAGVVPPEMEEYYFPLYGLTDTESWWVDDPMFDGKWKWTKAKLTLDGETVECVLVELHSTEFSDSRMEELDQMLDDGNLKTGRFREYYSRGSYCYIVGEGGW